MLCCLEDSCLLDPAVPPRADVLPPSSVLPVPCLEDLVVSEATSASNRLAEPAGPVVIYAEHRPRLSGPELLAKYGAVAPARPLARPERLSRRPPLRVAAGLPRIAWWWTLATGAMSAMNQAAGLPLI